MKIFHIKCVSIISSVSSDHSGVKLRRYRNRTQRNLTGAWSLNDAISSDQCVIQETREEIRDTAKVLLTEKFIAMCLHLKTIVMYLQVS